MDFVSSDKYQACPHLGRLMTILGTVHSFPTPAKHDASKDNRMGH